MRVDFDLPKTITTPSGETLDVEKLPDEIKQLIRLYVAWKHREEELKAELAMVQTAVNSISTDLNNRLTELKKAAEAVVDKDGEAENPESE